MTEHIFHCTQCGAKLSAAPNEIGEEFECPMCESIQIVPRPSTAPDDAPAVPGIEDQPPTSKRVVRVPKRKIVVPSTSSVSAVDDDDDEYLEDLVEEEIAGSGLRVAAMALGTAGVILCALAFMWALLAQKGEDENWRIMILTFTSTFLLALMGLVLAQIAFRVERIAAYVRRIGEGEED
jgi:DNA-directed RNA polymerase subunit RPC12/RpoP